MPALIQLLLQLLPLILRLFGLGAAGWAGLNYASMEAASPEGVALASGATAYYVGGPIASMFALLSAARGLDFLKRRTAGDAQTILTAVVKLIRLIAGNQELLDAVLELLAAIGGPTASRAATALKHGGR